MQLKQSNILKQGCTEENNLVQSPEEFGFKNIFLIVLLVQCQKEKRFKNLSKEAKPTMKNSSL